MQSTTLENFLSLLRALGTLIGAYLVGHALFGHTISADAWQVVSGAIMTIAATWWGIATKTTNIEGIESAARSVISALGGLGVSAGVVSGVQLAAILSAVIPIATFVQSALSKSKNQQMATGSVTPTLTGKAITAPPKIGSSPLPKQ